MAVPVAAAVGLVIRLVGLALRTRTSAAPPGPRQPLRLHLVALAWGIAGLVAVTGWYWADQAFHHGKDTELAARPVVVGFAVVLGLAAAIVVGGIVRVPLDFIRRRGWASMASIPILVAGVVLSVAVGGVAAVAVAASILDAGDTLGRDRDVWMAVTGGLLIVYLFGDQKRWSPHPLYKSRLARTFALTRCGPVDLAGSQQPRRLPRRVATTLSEWAAKPPRGPELLICGAVYDSVERRPDGLRAWPFVFSHRHVGGSDVGWARTVDFEAVLGRHNQSDGTLLAAMAISGAAVSPAIGRISLGSINALIAALNLRLGVWLPSPRSIELMRHEKFEPVPTWIRTCRFTYLFKEICGSYDLDARLVYVTDGGQFDNLGLFELLAGGARPSTASTHPATSNQENPSTPPRSTRLARWPGGASVSCSPSPAGRRMEPRPWARTRARQSSRAH